MITDTTTCSLFLKQVSRIVSTPLVKFITHTASYIVFLLFIFLGSTLVGLHSYESPDYLEFRKAILRQNSTCFPLFNYTAIDSYTFNLRTSSFNVFEFFIILFVVGEYTQTSWWAYLTVTKHNGTCLLYNTYWSEELVLTWELLLTRPEMFLGLWTTGWVKKRLPKD